MIIILMIAAILDLIAIALLVVTYQTQRDIWDKLSDIDRRLKKLERDKTK